MVADLAVVKNAAADIQLAVLLTLHAGFQAAVGLGQRLQRLIQLGDHIHGQVAAVGARIGEQLPFFVQRLGDFQRFIGGKAQGAVGIPLQRSKIIQLGRQLPFLLAGGAAHRCGFALDPGRQLLGLFPGGNAARGFFLRRFFIKPLAGVIAKVRRDGKVFHRFEVFNFLPALHQDIQRGRLHPADGKQGVIAQGKGPAGVHAHQPVGLAAAHRAFAQALVFAVRLDGFKALPDGLVGHGGDPQPVHRLFALGLVVDVMKNQFTLAPGVGGADHALGILIIDQLFDHRKLLLGFADHLGGDILRQDGQIVHPPFFVFFVDLVGLAQRHQMAHRPGNGVFLPGDAALAVLPAAQHPGDIAAHAGLFGYDYDHWFSPYPSAFSFSAWSSTVRASMISSRSPSTMASILYSVSPTRWSVTRPWGKL